MRKSSSLMIVGIFCLVVGAGFTGYKFFERGNVQVEDKQVQNQLDTVEAEVASYDEKNVKEAINAKKAVEELLESRILWSRVIRDVRQVIPDNEDGVPIIEIVSYSGSQSKDITLNVKTIPNAEEPYFDVADLIEAFDDEVIFMENFVPSIAEGTDIEGNTVLTFTLSTTHVDEDAFGAAPDTTSDESIEREESEEISDTIGEVLDESLTR